MKQKVITPPIKNCLCGKTPNIVPSDNGGHNYEVYFMVECACGKKWPKNASTKHRAICRWNHKISLANAPVELPPNGASESKNGVVGG